MSRHRHVRNLDLDEELDDAAFDDDAVGYDMTPEQAEQMQVAAAQVNSLLGPDTTITEQQIKDALWEYYFDVDQAVAFVLEDQHKKAARQTAGEPVETTSEAVPPIQEAPPSNGMASLSLGAGRKKTTLAELAAARNAKLPAISATSKPSLPSFASSRAPSKLAAKAAAARSHTVASPNPTEVVSIPPKGLTKLQLRAQGLRPIAAAAPPDQTVEEKVPEPIMPTSKYFASSEPASIDAQPSHFASTLHSSEGRVVSGSVAREPPYRDTIDSSSAFSSPSPDDLVLSARRGTLLAGEKIVRASTRAANRAKAASTSSMRQTPLSTPRGSQAGKARKAAGAPATPTSARKKGAGDAASQSDTTLVSRLKADVEAMGLIDSDDLDQAPATPPPPLVTPLAKEDILNELERRSKEEKPVLSLVVVGHVDAGKSTLMGRLLHDLGETSVRQHEANQRQSEKIGKASFAFAWTFDALPEERSRGVTIDVAVDSFSTEHRHFTLIDAPGHRDFVPNMISGASQADCAILVIDAAKGAFEAGFGEDGQTREHAVLIRSLGVQQVVVAINKLDTVGWSHARFENIIDKLQPFLQQTGFPADKISFLPCAAFRGENLMSRSSTELSTWYDGATLVDQLDRLSVPPRPVAAHLRIPISNVFKGGSGATGIGVSGRVESGIVSVGERLAVLPGDETGLVRSIEVDDERQPWAAAGSGVTIYLSDIDPVYLSIGCVLCSPSALIPLANTFEAQIIVFEISQPILAGTSVELFHHGANTPATVSDLNALLDRSTGAVIKAKPRMLQRNVSAKISVVVRGNATSSVGGTRKSVIAIEPFTDNKAMGRILMRRQGQTVAAGIVLSILS